MSQQTVWAYKPLPELNNETGFVICESEVFHKLIESGDAQDPRDGANHLKPIEYPEEVKEVKAPAKDPKPADETKDLTAKDPEGYETKEMKPAPKVKKEPK